ncbi:hypothetical protein Dda_5598 [Drechslerella dactyloides]|uniref:Uncharacterized protein n=1 Tax=Drechslerella dactyloides TaxID=74499 RepID=A0AAD6IXT2_DREDA|nr:hypothetical protein Dda_5598 [Drechslerella dactyloides]
MRTADEQLELYRERQKHEMTEMDGRRRESVSRGRSSVVRPDSEGRGRVVRITVAAAASVPTTGRQSSDVVDGND